MPPNVTLEQAAHFAKALAKGQTSRKKVALTFAEDVAEDQVRNLV